MFNLKKLFILSVSFTIVILVSLFQIGCSNSDDSTVLSNIEEPVEPFEEDTIYIDIEAPIIERSNIESISDRTKNLLMSNPRSTDLDVLYFYDELAEKRAYAITHPTEPNTWIYECYSNNCDTPIIVVFKQINPNTFVVYDEYGVELRTFTFNSDTFELWTYNSSISRRKLSRQDQFLCGTAFVAACYVFGEALAIPTGGASLAVSMGFFVASFYIC